VANVASAEKRNRQRLRRRTRNLSHLSKVRSTVKKVTSSITARDGKAKALLAEAIRVLDKAAQKGVLKRETASRKISRLTVAVAAAAKAAPVVAAESNKKAATKKSAAKPKTK
jgi:small subunit ribosomal protein S20